MAFAVLFLLNNRRNLRRNRIFRDTTNPLDTYDDLDLYKKFRFRRQDILEITDEIGEHLEIANRGLHTTLPCIQVCVALRFFASGSFQNVCADLMGISQPTASRIISRVTKAILLHAKRWIVFPDQREADKQKEKFYTMAGFPNVVGCIDGTHIRIQAPKVNEHEFVNRKNYHSLNVQVICNADLLFIDVIAKWPGSVHDARILRQSMLFAAFETHPKPLDGVFLADSGYMIRDWLLTPYLNPVTVQERRYNDAHTTTRCTVERAIGVAKRRWHCLRGLRLEPVKACQVTTVCFMLSNRARSLRLDIDSDEEDEQDNGDDVVHRHNADYDNVQAQNVSLRACVAAGQAERNRYVNIFVEGL